MNGFIKYRSLRQIVSKCIQISEFGTAQSSPVYELRTYGIQPKDLKAFLDLGTDWMHLRCSHSKLLGYWVSELGGISDVCHIWEYDDLSHRARVRKALSEDKDWMSGYLNKVLPMFRFQTNTLMTLAPGCKMASEVKPGGVYELQVLTKTDSASDISGDAHSSLLARFFSIVGPTNSEIRLWHHTDMDVAIDFMSRKAGDIKTAGHSRLLLPASWSPWK
ncbi:protein NipSnap homolog 3A-like [Gigantopelta aegis]|uniref:protein NipSnap homolog 3A-like n=1 Tax=Gigantopelta aegis TaxID=1735272 RepID=UPI001B88C1AB|nr:protein NipSnap homolog 3A-like [Gigantopelta aegis]